MMSDEEPECCGTMLARERDDNRAGASIIGRMHRELTILSEYIKLSEECHHPFTHIDVDLGYKSECVSVNEVRQIISTYAK